MHKPLRVEYRLSLWPKIGLLLLLIIYTVCLLCLDLSWSIRIGLLFLSLLVVLYGWKRLQSDSVDFLLFDGEQWLVSRAGEKQMINLHSDSFVSATLLMLVFHLPDQKKKQRLYFARDNISQQDYRRLCCLLRG